MSDETNAEPAPQPATATPPSPPAADAAFKAALKRHNDDAYALARDAWERAERLRIEAEDLKTRVPAEGSAVLSGDDANVFAKYRELGPIEDLAAKLAERDTFAATIAAHERRKLVEAAAAGYGYDPDVLDSLPGASAIDFEFVEEFRNGKKSKFAHVKLDGDAKKPLDQYAAETWPKFLPSLKATAAPQPHRTSTVPSPPQQAGQQPDRPRRRWSL